MDTTDLQKLIEALSLRLQHEQTAQEAGESASGENTSAILTLATSTARPTEESRAATDVGRLIADLLPANLMTDAATRTGNSVPGAESAQNSDVGVVGRAARSLVSGFGVFSVLSDLFGSGDSTEDRVPQLPTFELPMAVRQDLAFSSRTGEYSAFDRPEAGGLRMRDASPAAAITVNVNAMDSKSFLDRSDDIARAVREAMLNAHSLNDVVSEI